MNAAERHEWLARVAARSAGFAGWSFLSRSILIAVWVLGAPTAFAQINHGCTSSASNGAYATTNGPVPCSNSDSGQFASSKTIIVEDDGGSFPAIFTIGYSNSATASSSGLVLQASAVASVSNSPAFYEYSVGGNGAQINNPLISAASPEGDSSWFDQFVALGTGLLQFQVTMVVTGTPTSSECVSGMNDAVIRADVFFDDNGSGSGTINTFDPDLPGAAGLGMYSSACSGVQSTTTGVVTILASQSFSLGTELRAIALGFAGYPDLVLNGASAVFVQNGDSSVNAKLLVYIDPLTPGAGYRDSSGAINAYLTPPSTVVVPNLVRLSQLAATTAIVSTGLTVGTLTSQSSSSVPAGNVISQSPAAGASVADGSAVSLVISSGPAPVAVPNVVGKLQAAATSAITGAGLALGTVTNQSSSSVAIGTVISERPAAGTSVAAGSAVNLVISSGALQGDLNGDGVVNCADLAIIKASFGKKVGQAGFDPRADVNGDGVVNIIDLSTEARLMPVGTVCN